MNFVFEGEKCMNKPTRVTLAGLMTSALMLGLAGCGTNTNHLATTNQSTVNPTGSASTLTPQKGGVLIYALPPATNITWYFPIENGSNDTVANAMLSQQLYPGLFTINNQDAIDFRNGFATKITYNPTGTVYTIYLKKNWKWSDGTPVTAQDVVWDYSLIKATDASSAPAPWPNYNNGNGGVPKDVKSVVAVGKYMVKVTLNKPVNQQWFIYNGIGQLQRLVRCQTHQPVQLDLVFLKLVGVRDQFLFAVLALDACTDQVKVGADTCVLLCLRLALQFTVARKLRLRIVNGGCIRKHTKIL